MVDQPFRAPEAAALADVVAALGSRRFGPSLAAHADEMFGGHVCFVHYLQHGQMYALGAGHRPPDPTNALVPNVWRYTRQRLWEHDAALQSTLSRLDGQRDPVQFHDHEGRESRRHWPWQLPTPLVDKLTLCQRDEEGILILEFSRWGDCAGFGAQAVERVSDSARLLMRLAAAHRQMLVSRQDPAAAFRSVDDVERCLAQTTALTRRERQVCAWHLMGASSAATGSTLGIAADSVKSYRKRVYQRLAVSGERELLLKFLALRADWHGRQADLEAPGQPWNMPFLLPPAA